MRSRIPAILLVLVLLLNLCACASQAPKVYEVRFELNGGTLVSGQLLQHIEEGGAAVPPEVEREYFSFEGWDPAPGAAQGDLTCTAQWKARKLSSEEIFSKISPAVVEISAFEPSGKYYSLGSGFFIDGGGRLVTNYHVIDGTNSGEVTLADGSRLDILAVLDYDKALDLAVLQIDIDKNPYLAISDRPVSTGEAIYALGSSQGLTSTFSSGIVSTASREIDGVNCIQITAPISEGNSGGPLVDPYGEVVGVNSMTLLTGQNLNFAIDIHELEKLALDKSLTLAEVYALEHPNGESGSKPEEEGFYTDADYAENESNDIFLLSDKLPNGAWVAGEIRNSSDQDWFYLEVDGPCEVSFEVYPYYSDDMDYLLCGVLSLTDDEDVELMDALLPAHADDYDLFSGTVRFDAAGTYFLLLCVDEEYPFTDPSFYVLRASW